MEFGRFHRRRYAAQLPNAPKRRRSLRLPPLVPSVVVLGIGALAWFIFGSGSFTVKTVTIEGSLNGAVESELRSLQGKNIVLLQTGSIERLLPTRQSSLKTLRIVKGFPDTLKVNVSVREPVIQWRTADQRYFVDEGGTVFSYDGEIPASADQLPVVVDDRAQPIETGKRLVSHSFVSFLRSLTAAFQDRSGIGISGVSVGETTRHITVRTDANITVLFDATRELDPQLASLAAVLGTFRDTIHEYIDLRVEGKVFYK